MTSNSYTKTITVNTPIDAAFAAITTGFEHWWTTPEGVFHAVGDRAKFPFPPQESYWTFEVEELAPNSTVRMRCVEAHHILLDQPNASRTEWLDTIMKWTLRAAEHGTEVTFEHEGLIPGLACYEVCEAGWDHFFLGSLKAYLNTGRGTPHQA